MLKLWGLKEEKRRQNVYTVLYRLVESEGERRNVYILYTRFMWGGPLSFILC